MKAFLISIGGVAFLYVLLNVLLLVHSGFISKIPDEAHYKFRDGSVVSFAPRDALVLKQTRLSDRNVTVTINYESDIKQLTNCDEETAIISKISNFISTKHAKSKLTLFFFDTKEHGKPEPKVVYLFSDCVFNLNEADGSAIFKGTVDLNNFKIVAVREEYEYSVYPVWHLIKLFSNGNAPEFRNLDQDDINNEKNMNFEYSKGNLRKGFFLDIPFKNKKNLTFNLLVSVDKIIVDEPDPSEVPPKSQTSEIIQEKVLGERGASNTKSSVIETSDDERKVSLNNNGPKKMLGAIDTNNIGEWARLCDRSNFDSICSVTLLVRHWRNKEPGFITGPYNDDRKINVLNMDEKEGRFLVNFAYDSNGPFWLGSPKKDNNRDLRKNIRGVVTPIPHGLGNDNSTLPWFKVNNARSDIYQNKADYVFHAKLQYKHKLMDTQTEKLREYCIDITHKNGKNCEPFYEIFINVRDREKCSKEGGVSCIIESLLFENINEVRARDIYSN